MPDVGQSVVKRARPSLFALRAALAAASIGVLAFFYRFNALGGALGGFGNDHFIHLSRARQIVGGELPFRDFSDPGLPLTAGISALVQWAGGYHLLGEALLTVGAIAASAALTVWLAARVTGRVWPAILVGILAVAIAPRLYNYPKVLLTAAGVWLAWRYVDAPSRARVVILSAFIAIGFLIRHDYLLYLGILFGLTVVLAHREQIGTGLRRTAALGAVALIFVTPFLVFLQLSGGVVEYVRQAMEFTRADTQRTSFRWPTLDVTLSTPIASMAPEEPEPPATVNVRWAEGLAAAERERLEAQLHLRGGEFREGTTWVYELGDDSKANVEALVKHPMVLDTHGVNRTTFEPTASRPERGLSAALRRVRLAPELSDTDNAVAWLYYTLFAVPFAAGLAWMLRSHSKAYDRAAMRAQLPYLWPVIILMGVLVVGFLSRGTIEARLADVSVPAAILIAWLICPARERSGVRRAATTRFAVRLALLVSILAGTWATAVAGSVQPTADRSGFFGGLDAIQGRARTVRDTLRASPPVHSLVDGGNTPFAVLARWVSHCTTPTDRVLVVGNMPELYFFSGRLMAGGHAWFVPGYATSRDAQAQTLERVRSHSVPVVVTDTELYETNYRPEFPAIDRYVTTEYRPIGTLPIGETTSVRLLLSRHVQWKHVDAETGLACGSPAAE